MAGFPSRDRDAFMLHWKNIMADESVIIKTILENGEVAGNVVCFEQLGEREVGYWLGREFWGRGVATAALTKFLEQIPTRPLYAHVAKQNFASKRVLEKCGFRVVVEDKFFSKIFGEDMQEYILRLNPMDSSDPVR
jgi:RimJ/RimL family protein N-acetyltransferase